ncbi:MAG: hypothetical protein G3M70_15470 [Candidatus Nitronauta litoralis]|uniref:Teneurin NHL domain-containing protein n=1 Tax=Candidatus Nitronauta litoralis TaxID=2705533 RepID=A0A7T0BYF6_9BACT|nr:MAG: hypothetical protein G3M70_15470 [Candidatus Nitronauta litoralis]
MNKLQNQVTWFLAFFLIGSGAVLQANAKTWPYPEIGDGKPAIDVPLTLVDGVTVDKSGNIFLSHRSQNRVRKVGLDGKITTVAGNGAAGFSGDGGPALDAALNFPAGLCIGPDEDLYIADRNNHRIRKVDKHGIITTVAGNGLPEFTGDGLKAVEASLHFPSDIACQNNGGLIFSDRSNSRIRKVDTNGIITTIAGMGEPDFGGDYGMATEALLKYPFGVELDAKGNLYIADRGNNRIRMVRPDKTIVTIAGDGNHFFSGDYGPAPRASLAYPTDVVKDEEGNLYIADRNNNRIRRVDPLGIITTLMGIGEYEYNGDNEVASETSLHLPFALAMAPGNRLIVVDRSHFRVRQVDLKTGDIKTIAGNGKALFKGDGGPGLGASLRSPTGIVVKGDGSVIFSDKQSHRIRRVDPNGFIHTIAGTGKQGNEGDGGPADHAALFLPGEMALDSKENLYVVSPVGRGSLIRKISPDGIITTFAGMGGHGSKGDGGKAIDAAFSMLKDITIDSNGNMYLVDYSNRNIRKITPNGIISTIAPNAINSLPDHEVHINGIAVDKKGNVFFSDSGSSKIRKISPDGKISIFAGNGDFEDSGDGGPAIEAGIRSPGGLKFGPEGDLYIIEETSNRIRKIDKKGIITTVAGKGLPGYSGDGKYARDALLKAPYRMAFDKQGNLYFTDRDNNRIRKIDKNGIITSIAGNENIGWMQDGLEVRVTVHNFP